MSKVILDVLADKLTTEDDPRLWQAALDVLLEEFLRHHDSQASNRDWVLLVGACSHWVRPHNSRWHAAGGFAWPEGYRNSLPELDWRAVVAYNGRRWVNLQKFPGKKLVVLRVAIPTRSARHKQATIHAKWPTNQEPVLFGFRKLGSSWKRVAASDEIVNGRISGPDNPVESEK